MSDSLSKTTKLYIKRIKILVISGLFIWVLFEIPHIFYFQISSYFCQKKGGDIVYHPYSMARNEYVFCNVDYPDGGKECQSNSECMGDCIKVPDNNENGKCSPATLYHGDGIHRESKAYKADKPCPFDERKSKNCELELFNKSDQWKDYHSVK